MNNKPLLIFAALTFAFFSCKKPPTVTNKVITTTEAKPETHDIKIEEIDFQYFSSKSKVNFQFQNEDQTAIVNVRMKKDSLIWLSVNKVGIEGFRALITPDSIYVLEQLSKTYYVKDFKSLSKQFNFTISYSLLQSILLGNLPFETLDRKALKVKDYYLLRQENGSITVENFIGIENKKVAKVEMVEQPSRNSLMLNYANFAPLNNYLFPFNSAFYLKYDTNQKSLSTLITVECKKAELHTDELKFPFNIPKRYERK
ncbi:MAG: DUF4292 domain-containing protein [Bacteroidota bacterium]